MPPSTKSPICTSYAMTSPGSSTMTMKSGHGRRSSRESDLMNIGYGHGNGVRRRGSVTPTISDAGSDDAVLNSTSSGSLEMFLRGGV